MDSISEVSPNKLCRYVELEIYVRMGLWQHMNWKMVVQLLVFHLVVMDGHILWFLLELVTLTVTVTPPC